MSKASQKNDSLVPQEPTPDFKETFEDKMSGMFEEQKEEISIRAMTAYITTMRELRASYEAAKALSTQAHDAYKEAESLVLDALTASGLKKFNVDGLGTATVKKKFQVVVPQDVEDKRKIYKYIQDQYGADILDEYRSINYQSLNSFYNQEAEIAADNKRDLVIPGLAEPTVKETVAWTKDRVKKK